jgi:hypothetical protein
MRTERISASRATSRSAYTKEETKMNKEKYDRIELEVIEFRTEDVLLTSVPDEYEGEMP